MQEKPENTVREAIGVASLKASDIIKAAMLVLAHNSDSTLAVQAVLEVLLREAPLFYQQAEQYAVRSGQTIDILLGDKYGGGETIITPELNNESSGQYVQFVY